MTREKLDAVFISYYEDIDRWHNDLESAGGRATGSKALLVAPGAAGDHTLLARMARQSVGIDGQMYDFARFMSWARYGHTREYRRFDAFTPTHLSGTYYQSLCARHGYNVHHVNHATRVDLAHLGASFAPRFVLLSTTLMTETVNIIDAVQHIRRAWPGVPLILGGLVLVELEKSIAPAEFQKFLRALGADAYVVSAMAEEPLLAILAAEGNALATLSLPNTWVRSGRNYVKRSELSEHGLAMDDNYVRWELVDRATMYHTVHTRTARSCAFTCSFCSYFSNQGPLVLESPQTLERELEALTQLGGVRSIIFTDDTFNVPRGRFKDICRVLAKYDFEWYSFFRAQFADETTASMMADSGCRGVFLGIESLDDRVLKNMNKAATVEAYARGIVELKRNGVATHANFIIGFPGDVPENTPRIVEFLDRHEIDFFNVNPWYCSPATPIHHEREKYAIEGQFWHWKHATMNSDQAIELENWVMSAPKSAVFMSELSAQSFWTELLFYSNDYSVDELQTVTRAFNHFAGKHNTSDALRSTAEYAALKRVLVEREMPLVRDSQTLIQERGGRSNTKADTSTKEPHGSTTSA